MKARQTKPATAKSHSSPQAQARSSAWLQSMTQACNLLNWKEEEARQRYTNLNGHGGKLPVRSTEPPSTYILAQLVREVYHLKHLRLSSKRNDPHMEQALLELLHAAVSNKTMRGCGMESPLRYEAGTEEEEDSKLVRAAILTIKSYKDAKKKGNRVPSPQALREHDEKHERQRRIDQALLKMDRWADAWLSGAMPHTDLAWSSFEFCLWIPDVLEEGEVQK